MNLVVRNHYLAWLLLFGALTTVHGCRSRSDVSSDPTDGYYQWMATQIEYPDASCLAPRADVRDSLPPRTLRNGQAESYWDLTLEEAIRTALENSQVMRDIGGTLVRSPSVAVTVFDPAVQETDPQTGTEAALSAFDADLGTGLFYGKDQRVFNNAIFGGGTDSLDSTAIEHQTDITKRSATGTQFSIRNRTVYDRNTSPISFQQFSSSWNTAFETEFRHPLMQGGGIAFNRIAGPNSRPGVYNGVLVARIRTDITLAEFERSVRDLLRDVERSYWELYYAYRDLDAKVAGRNAALDTWQVIQKQLERRIADREQESLARERYFAAQSAVENALSGRADATAGGVYAVERRLRLLMGLPTNTGALIRPADEPMTVDMLFDWDDSLGFALMHRLELRRQKWVIKQRELERTAAWNFTRPQLDFIGLYRRNGFGNDLFGNNHAPFSSAMESVLTDSLDGWQIGMELRTPIGNRIGHTALRNAELRLLREQAIYREQELAISHELSGALAELDRAYTLVRTNYNRRIAALEQVDAVRRKFDTGITPLEFLLDAIRRATEADSAYYRLLADYNQAVANVHLTRGSFLASHGVYLTEGPWSVDARRQADRLVRRVQRRGMDHGYTSPPPISAGAYRQHPLERLEADALEVIEADPQETIEAGDRE